MKKILPLIIFAFLLTSCSTAQNNSSNRTSTNPAKPSQQITATGLIEGSLSYPGSIVPIPMEVCAKNIITNKEYCTSESIKDEKYTYGYGYILEVPTGEYYVYVNKSKRGDYKAYYSEIVVCGLIKDCGTHDPIIVKVSENHKSTNIDPQDWYRPE